MSESQVVGTANQADPYPDVDSKPIGPVNAALIAGGVGCVALGLCTSLVEASKPVKNALTLNVGVGPLSGKVAGAVLVWLVAWVILHFALRKSTMAFRTAFVIALIGIIIGLVGTFPLVFQAFG